jgi:hypothetical protein
MDGMCGSGRRVDEVDAVDMARTLQAGRDGHEAGAGPKPWPEDDPGIGMNRHERRKARAERRRDEGRRRAQRNDRQRRK